METTNDFINETELLKIIINTEDFFWPQALQRAGWFMRLHVGSVHEPANIITWVEMEMKYNKRTDQWLVNQFNGFSEMMMAKDPTCKLNLVTWKG